MKGTKSQRPEQHPGRFKEPRWVPGQEAGGCPQQGGLKWSHLHTSLLPVPTKEASQQHMTWCVFEDLTNRTSKGASGVQAGDYRGEYRDGRDSQKHLQGAWGRQNPGASPPRTEGTWLRVQGQGPRVWSQASTAPSPGEPWADAGLSRSSLRDPRKLMACGLKLTERSHLALPLRHTSLTLTPAP